MGLLEKLGEEKAWERFYRYKSENFADGRFLEGLRDFIDRKAYLPVFRAIQAGEEAPLPARSVINKISTGKRRVVYTYPEPWNMVLKLLTWLLGRRYDHLCADNLWSFRPGRGAKDAVRRLSGTPGICGMYGYKADISDYFNSVDVDLLLPMMENALAGDPDLLRFLSALLKEDRVLDKGAVRTEKKGIMAGTPLASFYANLYLGEMDRHFEEKRVIYARYSDDLILFSPGLEELEEHVLYIKEFLDAHHLMVNRDKEYRFLPGEKWEFLGFSFRDGTIDISEVSRKKLAAKMRRKTRALRRWQMRKGLSGEKAAKAFIRAFNRKLFESAGDHDLTWTRWYYPVINTADSLRVIDHYAQDCIRYLAAGTRTKARFFVRYETLKELGYRSLVHEFFAKDQTVENSAQL
ncbi:MAG: hypothetical protein K6E83_11330 [Clostridium sp.]|nr:hypothetical protein [Clostridium sp.]